MAKLELIATAAFGLEAVVAHELKQLGYNNTKVENGRVTFVANEQAICHTNLWLRSAERVLLKVGEFKATTFEELFQQTKALPWTELLPVDANFPVEGKSIKSKLFSVSDCQAIVKKAIVEKMKEVYGLEWFTETGPKFTVEVALLKDVVTLTIDTSGAGLHKRGYRKLTGKAPIKETLAAAMVMLSYWNADRILLDPLCGTGTIPIEAALIGQNIAPGLTRNFAAEEWPWIPKKIWQEQRRAAHKEARYDLPLKIIGSDIDKEALSMARYHAGEAGVDEFVSFQPMDVANLSTKKKYGCIICNPPYGERLKERPEVELLYQQMGKAFLPLDTWSYYIITSNTDFEKHFGKKADKKRKVYNGRIRCDYYQYFGPRPPKRNESPEQDK
ncbi:THUMP domain-containing class I SAM-dependent RNA methyltransferase [Desulfofalx alkaliphila]|uniref:THUMP domain-containing class I SAM-dependent RNA methyltransferase n=1 Tax=Desulfofalx alkaliphila TaxID=105483 RepID=UPI0004E26F2E|nr:class I SAM-dependent RNA methyltransferase [Desulfofalx alkaliphila]